ncbi:hypothetical protein HPB51_021176 [Rhipicephalus microplus]|uniref:Acetyl-coa transporter n=1 Tax=Rhipicephalus microplus TaxID=6941 RepID=A0A9J6F6A8_RHIMP|nr:hypothetical protein HPB51_021176 [Rhipicephalus microplus]
MEKQPHVTQEQALFSLAAWPFSVKLLWAPIVDSLYSSRFGRRKSWLVPAQYAIGLSFFWLSSHMSFLLGEGEGSSKTEPSVLMLTLVFFSLNFLAATQDIAVDGWALTMLSRRHVGYASTCNSVGQTVGYIMGNVVFLALESADFCNRYLRSTPQQDGIVTLDAADNVTGMKLLEAGMRRENLALLAIPVAPIQILLPVIISKHTGGNRPLNVYFKAYPYRLLLGLVFMVLVHWTYHVKNPDGTFPLYYYVAIVLVYAVYQVTLYSSFVSSVAFCARVSDPAVGGTYMTLLNTVSNLGSSWPATVALWMVDSFTFKRCVGASEAWLYCSSKEDKNICSSQKGTCETTIDGYNIEMVFCIALGFLWLLYARRKANWLQSLPQSAWKCT